MKEQIIDYLLQHANPSIRLRVQREVLNNLSPIEEAQLLAEIARHPHVQTVLQAQQADGWIGNVFHGASPAQGAGMFDNMEVGLRYLMEKGFPPEHEHIRRAVHSFLADVPGEFRGPGPADEYDLTAIGQYLLRSSIIIRAGYEYTLPPNPWIHLAHDVDVSFRTFTNVLNFHSLDQVVDTTQRKLCFQPGMAWPCSYDLRMLAHSQGWRGPSHVALLAQALNHLFSFPHAEDKMVYTKIKSQYKSPCLAFIHNQMFCLGMMDPGYFNFDLMELFARLGVMDQVPFLKNKLDWLLGQIDHQLNIRYKPPAGERNWGPYGGYALEDDWKSKTRKQCDLLFRVLLILHYGG